MTEESSMFSSSSSSSTSTVCCPFFVAVLMILTQRGFAQLASSPASECSQHFSSSARKSGTFSSPNYPAPYPPDVTCLYSFHGQGRERVQIIVTVFNLHYDYMLSDPSDTPSCDDADSLTAIVTSNGTPRDLGVYCGPKRPPMLMSTDSRLDVSFTSRSRSSDAMPSGFLANYSFVTDFGIKTGVQQTDFVCAFAFRSEVATNGTFTSPNFPGYYPRNTECHYLFYGQDTDFIYIMFPYFDVEGIPPRCKEDTMSDYIEFSNFNIQLTDRKMARFCGSKEYNSRRTVSSDGSFFRVTFKSNDLYDATGFEAFYQFRQIEDPYPAGRKSNRPNSAISELRTATTMTTNWLFLYLLSAPLAVSIL